MVRLLCLVAALFVAFSSFCADQKPAEARVDKSVAAQPSKQRFAITMEAIGLFRTAGADEASLVFSDRALFLDPSDDVEVVNTKDLGFADDLAFSAKLTFSYLFSDRDAVEGSYFGFDMMDWEQSRTLTGSPIVAGPDQLYLPFDGESNNFTYNFDNADLLKVTYRSELNHNAEVNYRRTCIASDSGSLLAGSGLLAGLRYMNIEEQLTFRATDPGFNNPADYLSLYQISTGNDLLGAQIGGNLALNPHSKIRLDLTAKAAFMANMVDKKDRFQGADNFGGVLAWNNSTDSTEFAFIGDVALRVSGQVHKNVWLTAGYTAMFVDGIALAPEQFDSTETRTQFHKISYGDAIYHGFNAGVTVKW